MYNIQLIVIKLAKGKMTKLVIVIQMFRAHQVSLMQDLTKMSQYYKYIRFHCSTKSSLFAGFNFKFLIINLGFSLQEVN